MAVNALRIERLESIDGQICHTMVQYRLLLKNRRPPFEVPLKTANAAPCLVGSQDSRRATRSAASGRWRMAVRLAAPFNQGLTLVPLSAQRKRFWWDKGFRGWSGCMHGGGGGVVDAYRGCFECQNRLKMS